MEIRFILILLFTIYIASSFAFMQQSRVRLNPKYGINQSKLNARVAKDEKATEESKEDKVMSIPFDGILGSQKGSLFVDPLEVFDPMRDTQDLPGEDGSDEKIQAIMQRIEERVSALKKSGEWDDGDKFGSDPMANIPLWSSMAMQVKASKPFESWDALALTYILLMITTVAMSSYLLVLREILNNFMLWFTGSDFDSEFMNEVMRNVSA